MENLLAVVERQKKKMNKGKGKVKVKRHTPIRFNCKHERRRHIEVVTV